MLLLNDGMVRTLTWRAKSSATLLGLWVRAGIDAHVSVVRDELADSLPGARTVISSGWTAAHSFSEVQFDDLVLDFTRARPGMSKLAEMTGNPVVVSNPAPLQLNTAFSRAYLLDAAGSKHGISGARVYLDSQFIDDISSEFQGRKGFRVNNWERSNDRIFALERLSRSIRKTTPRQIPTLAEWAARQPAVEAGIIRVMQEFPSRRQPWVFGFLLERDHITVNLPNLQTTVYRVLAFFPHDEDPSDFMVDL